MTEEVLDLWYHAKEANREHGPKAAAAVIAAAMAADKAELPLSNTSYALSKAQRLMKSRRSSAHVSAVG